MSGQRQNAGTTAARRAAAQVLLDVEKGAYANLRLKEALQGLTETDRPFCAALVYTTLEHQIYLDWVIEKLTKGSIKPAVRIALRMGLCQMLRMNVPESAACNESVKLIKSMGKSALAGYINGVMRNAARSRDQLSPPEGMDARSLSIRHSWPLWLVEGFLERFGLDLTERLLAPRTEEGQTIRVNPFAGLSEESVIRELEERGVSLRRGALCPQALYASGLGNIAREPLFERGAIAVQGESSQLVCRAADPQPGDRVLDACAAPGGKSLCMAAQMGRGSILSWDLHPHRTALIEKNAKRLGVDWIRTEVQDAAQFRPELEKSFDLVLVDAPCSGLGVAGGKPDVKYAKSPEGIRALSETQRAILETCCRYVRPGGTLMYATCTISHAENEAVTEGFLKAHEEFEPADLTGYLPEDFSKERCAGGRVQLLPPLDGTDGFYLAKMKRRDG